MSKNDPRFDAGNQNNQNSPEYNDYPYNNEEISQQIQTSKKMVS